MTDALLPADVVASHALRLALRDLERADGRQLVRVALVELVQAGVVAAGRAGLVLDDTGRRPLPGRLSSWVLRELRAAAAREQGDPRQLTVRLAGERLGRRRLATEHAVGQALQDLRDAGLIAEQPRRGPRWLVHRPLRRTRAGDALLRAHPARDEPGGADARAFRAAFDEGFGHEHLTAGFSQLSTGGGV